MPTTTQATPNRLPATMFLLLQFTSVATTGCPSWQRPACPSPGAYRCANDLPEYCAPTRQWTTNGDEPCARQGRTCALAPDGVAWCAPTMDGGVQ